MALWAMVLGMKNDSELFEFFSRAKSINVQNGCLCFVICTYDARFGSIYTSDVIDNYIL